MRLVRAQVTNYRSVENSEEFSVDDMLCLVGKNEAGKTAVLQAIAGINPHPLTQVVYNRERDYPRRFLTEYDQRHPHEQAVVATTWWRPEADCLKLISEEIGAQGLKDQPVMVLRRYEGTDVEWSVPIDDPKAVEFLIERERLNDHERRGLKTESSEGLRKSLESLEQPTDRQKLLLERLNAMPEKSVHGLAISILKDHLPQFMFFTHYDRMAGEMRVDDITGSHIGRVHSPPDGQLRPLEAGETVFLDFLEFAGASIEEIRKSKTYESLNAKCEAASIAITDQLREYWAQNPHLDVDIRVTKAESGDPRPLDAGTIARARVKNTVNRVSVPFSERSAGFIWFFSFLVKFAQVRELGGNLVVLLDEPGLTLHGKAQADLLRYFADKITPDHQLIYSTHSPFMVPADDLTKSRIVEDQLVLGPGGRWTTMGTKVREDVLATDPDTLLPLQGALGYEVTKTLFKGRNTLLVEGPEDVLFLQCFSQQLRRRNRTALDRRWTICPAGGIEKIQSFVSLFSGGRSEVAVITGYDIADHKKLLERLRRSQVVKAGRLLIFADALGLPEADVEDIFDPEVYLRIVNQAYQLPAADRLTTAKLDAAAPAAARLIKRVEAAFKFLPLNLPKFDRFTPADWLMRNPDVLDGNGPRVRVDARQCRTRHPRHQL